MKNEETRHLFIIGTLQVCLEQFDELQDSRVKNLFDKRLKERLRKCKQLFEGTLNKVFSGNSTEATQQLVNITSVIENAFDLAVNPDSGTHDFAEFLKTKGYTIPENIITEYFKSIGYSQNK